MCTNAKQGDIEVTSFNYSDDDLDQFSHQDLHMVNESSNVLFALTNIHASRERWDFVNTVDSILGAIGGALVICWWYIHAYNPLHPNGWLLIRNLVLRSGPTFHPPSKSEQNSKINISVSGWKMGAVLNLAILLLCLLVEIAMLVGARHLDKSSATYDGVIYQGDCTTTKRWGTILALALNIVATIVIGSGNYMLQSLCAPTGTQIRSAHANGCSFDMGVLMYPKVQYLSRKKVLLWWSMALASVPVHLLFNSAFFPSLAANNYAIAIVASDFENAALWPNCSESKDVEYAAPYTDIACEMARNASQYERLENAACIDRYAISLVSDYSSVILVSNLTSTDAAKVEKHDALANFHDPNSSSESNASSFPVVTYVAGSRVSVNGIAGSGSSTSFPAAYGGVFNASSFPGLLGVFDAYHYAAWRWSKDSRDYSAWMCKDNSTYSSCTVDAAKQYASNWVVTPANITIDHCLSRKSPNQLCQLEYSSVILVAVIICDFLKLVVICVALTIDDSPCVTIGDVAEHFLQSPENISVGRCLINREQVGYETSRRTFSVKSGEKSLWPDTFAPKATQWKSGSHRWFRVVPPRRGGFWLFLWTAALTLSIGVFASAFASLSSQGADKGWTRGLTGVDLVATFQSVYFSGMTTNNFLLQVVIINTPQLLLSTLYLLYNGLFTIMHAATEWQGYASEHKPLRVSNPKPGQRSTYWLNLPWSYSIPIAIVSILLHWLVSRCIYLVNVNVIGANGIEDPSLRILACGYSTLMMLFFIVALLIMPMALSVFGKRKLDTRIPLIGTSSFAISAACHHPNDKETEATLPLQWGVVEKPSEGQPGHCSLSSGKVSSPVSGEYYW